LKIGHRTLLLAFAALLIAAGSASAGNYSPAHLRAEGFLRLDTLDYEPKVLDLRQRPKGVLFEKQRSRRRIKIEYQLKQRPMGMQVRVQAKPGLRRLVNLEVRF
jgi:hypothetical protein